MQDPNYLAIAVSAIVYMILGCIWYSPSCFGKLCTSCCKTNEKEMTSSCKPTAKCYICGFIAAFIMAWVLSHVVMSMNSHSIVDGIYTGFWMWPPLRMSRSKSLAKDLMRFWWARKTGVRFRKRFIWCRFPAWKNLSKRVSKHLLRNARKSLSGELAACLH